MKIILCPQTFYFHWGHNIDLYNNKMYDLRTDNVNMVTFEKRLYVTPRYRICQSEYLGPAFFGIPTISLLSARISSSAGLWRHKPSTKYATFMHYR